MMDETARAAIVGSIFEDMEAKSKTWSERAAYAVVPDGYKRKLIEIAMREWQPEYAAMEPLAVEADLRERVEKSGGVSILIAIGVGIIFLPILPLVIACVVAWWLLDKAFNGTQLEAARHLEIDFKELNA